MKLAMQRFAKRAAAGLSRRRFFGLATAGGVGALLPGETAAESAQAPAPRRATYDDNIYTRLLGVQPVIGAFETLSHYGNARLPAEVLDAMAEATEFFVDMEELNRAAGRRLAEITRAEAAMVTSCSFASMVLGAAACLTGLDEAKSDALPHPTWPRRECLMHTGHRFGYDRAYRVAGAMIVEVETTEQLVNAISDRTAFIAGMGMVERDPRPDVPAPAALIDIGRRTGVPVLIDAAGELPPASGLTRYTAQGADLVVISGGKALHGPSSTGILAGRRDLIEAALRHAAPNQGIGRGMKVGREEIVGLVVAVERYLELNETAMLTRWTRMAEHILEALRGIPGVTARLRMTAKGYADVVFDWDRDVIPLTERDVAERLKNGEPRIAYMPGSIIYAYTGPTIVTASLRDGEEVLVARRLRQFFLEEAPRG